MIHTNVHSPQYPPGQKDGSQLLKWCMKGRCGSPWVLYDVTGFLRTVLAAWGRFLVKHVVLLIQNSGRVYDQWCLLHNNRKRERKDGKHSLLISLPNYTPYETL